MADIPQLLANYDALVGVALGAGLTYGFSALNRRHQEARENETRWYNTRLQAYSELLHVWTEELVLGVRAEQSTEGRMKVVRKLTAVSNQIQLVGTPEVVDAANTLNGETTKEIAKGKNYDDERIGHLFDAFIKAARKDLGHPSP